MTLRAALEQLDGKPYGHYRALRGRSFDLDALTLCFDWVQGDPFAAPSRIDLAVPADLVQLPDAALANDDARRATADLVHRTIRAALAGASRERAGSGKSGRLEIAALGQEVLDRTAVRVHGDGALTLRVTGGLPANGRRILGRAAADLLVSRLPDAVARALIGLRHETVCRHVGAVEDQVALRAALAAAGLVGFLAEGSVLPRRSGTDSRPMCDGLALQVPDGLAVELDTPHSGTLRGLGVPRGVTLIAGGGYHGKSTLLAALALGVYDHVPGDGRERCVTDADAVCVRAEDGRSVRGVDLGAFIGALPLGRRTDRFDTDDASGSTSQAAATVEALEAGARALLIDEDTAATNFMIRDARMRELVPAAQEPITPYLDRVRELWEVHGVSSVLVVGGAGDYLDVADTVLQMDGYQPRDVTERARTIAQALPLGRGPSPPPVPLRKQARRIPDPASLDTRRGRRLERVRSVRTRSIEFGRDEIDVSLLYQLVDAAQCRAIGDLLLALARGGADGRRDLPALLDALEARIVQDGLDAVCEAGYGDRARPRRYEVAAALNRLRGLRLIQE